MPDLSLEIPRLDSSLPNWREPLDALREKLSPRGDVVSPAGRQKTIEVFGEPLAPVQVVERICREVEQRGLAAVLEYSLKLDGKELTADSLRVPEAELQAAHAAADPEFLATIRRIRENILTFQRAILHDDARVPLSGGGYLRQRYTPIRRAGICVPGGAAAYPSTVLMTAVPAQAAGVRELAVVAPPTPFGSYNQDLLATCHEIGICEVYRMGGAQAVAALAFGVEGVPRVDKIVGPGNLFVALAKKHVFGQVDIDSIAGPSEVVVVADRSARADFLAAELIAQAEHSPGASILITWERTLLDAVHEQLTAQLAKLSRGDLARASLEEFGALILVEDSSQAVALTNEIAPEHLHLACDEAETLLERIDSAGAAFVGPYTAVALGDYVAGPSHVLPTGGTARFASGLSANSFLRSSSVVHYTREDLSRVAEDLQRMAEKEGLSAHWESVRRRNDGT
ncbi:MAG: histidinol dehydrogenase [Planctomycetales bacterium]|nr:histidinol dehydrogenase [Planctomycetales bacterium]